MSIIYQESTKTFYLDGKNVTYAFFINYAGYAEHLYFGKKIPHDDLLYTRMRGPDSCIATAPGRDDQFIEPIFSYIDFPPEVSFFGTGDYREPTILAQMADGSRLSDLLYDGYSILNIKPKIEGMPSLSGGETLVIHLVDSINFLKADLYYTVYDDCDIITRRIVYINDSDKTINLKRAYSFAIGLPGHNYEALSLYGSWGHERMVDRTPLHHGVFSIDSKRATSSAVLNPFLGILEKGADEDKGEVYGFNLVYSSSWILKAQVTLDGQTIICGGINDFDFSWKLDPKEEFSTPEIVISYSNEGLGGMSRAFHDAYREHLIPAKHVKSPRPLLINNWEATYFDFNNEKLMSFVDAIENTGIDTLVLDDGWFGARRDDTAGLGDWVVSEDVLEGGLSTIINYANSKGIKFGLWFEPEMVNEDSNLFREHPDYAIGVPGHGRCYSRHQFVLDLTRSDVRDYIVNSVNNILHNNNVQYVKWDFNRNVTEFFSAELPAERQSEFAHRYALGLYDLCDRIIGGNPNVFFEGCAGGGARFDPAILSYFPQIWTSDNTDANERATIQYGTSLVYPLSAMSCHVSACPNHQTLRVTSMETRSNIAHLGATGYELDPTQFSNEDKEQIKYQIDVYHKMQNLILEGDLYRLNTPNDNEFSFLVVSKDKSNAELLCYRRNGGPGKEIYRVRVKGLSDEKNYYVPELNATLSGRTLSCVGIPVAFKYGDYMTAKYHFVEK